MKKALFTLVLLFNVFNSYSQDKSNKLEQEFNSYMELCMNEDFEKLMDYVIDDFFTYIPKDQLITVFKNLYNNPSMKFKLLNPKVLSVGESNLIEDKHYAVIEYSITISMLFIQESPLSPEELETFNTNMLTAFRTQYGEDKVKLDTETQTFFIDTQQKVACKSDNGIDHWKFITLEKNTLEILNKFLPESIIKQI